MERRTYERFQLALPTRVEVVSSGGGQVFEAQTRDISAKGAFLNTRKVLPEGTGVRLDLSVESERISGEDYFKKTMKQLNKTTLIRPHQPHAKPILSDKRCLTLITSFAYSPYTNYCYR